MSMHGSGYGLPTGPPADESLIVGPSWAQRNTVSYDDELGIIDADEPGMNNPFNIQPPPASNMMMTMMDGPPPSGDMTMMIPPQEQYFRKPKKKIAELNCCQKLWYGGCIKSGPIQEEVERRNPGVPIAGASVQQGGIILMAHGVVAIFPDDMPEMEDCFYFTMGIAHALFGGIFLALGICALAFGCSLRYTLGGIWCTAPIAATAAFSFIIAKHELRTNLKKLIICCSLAFFSSIAFSIISYYSAAVDGIYYKWADVENDKMFKARSIIDGVGICIGAFEAVACLVHMSSLLTNLKPELMYRCCSRKRFRRYLKEEAKKQEAGEERHLHKKKEMMQKLILDLEEEERYKEKWQRQQDKALGKKMKESAAWGDIKK